MKKIFSILLIALLSLYGRTQDTLKRVIIDSNVIQNDKKETKKKWYESFAIRGYTQFRYNRFLETNSNLNCEQCDKSIGNNNAFFLRRMRIIFFGNVHERVYIYIQPDFASSASSTGLHFGQLRDAYFDVSLDKSKEFRIRFGQSKIPYGFENMQSSQNRLALDRNDALNSAVSNERDMGAFFYWAPKKTRKLFSDLVNDGLKGSGDYGVFALGVYNGQTANRPEMNNNVHLATRLSYPFQLKNQIVELGLQGYSGKYVVTSKTKGVISKDKDEYLDERFAGSITWYPKPIGFQAEYNIGTGPQYNPLTNSIEQKKLNGGYAQIMGNINWKSMTILPFVKYQHYNGGKKHELDARSYNVKDLEIGIEWQPNKNFELVTIYTISDRTYEDGALKNNHQKGNLLRLQFQANF
jgi:hypothetical protein